MNSEAMFLGCFILGLVFTVASFLGGPMHIGHLHAGHWHAGAHGGRAGSAAWLNAFSAAGFLCWFGGIGFLLERSHGFSTLAVLVFALIAGCAGAATLSLFLVKVLMRNERSLQPEDTEMRGVLARVSSGVRSGGVGEIIFSLNGTRRSSAARSRDAHALPRGTEVVVVSYSKGVAWIAPFHSHQDPDSLQQTAAQDLP